MTKKRLFTSSLLIGLLCLVVFSDILINMLLDGPASIFSPLLGDKTEYAANYNAVKFYRVKKGDLMANVTESIGKPLSVSYEYLNSPKYGHIMINEVGEKLEFFRYHKPPEMRIDKFAETGNLQTLESKLGQPDLVHWTYAQPREKGSHKIRVLTFTKMQVSSIRSEYFID